MQFPLVQVAGTHNFEETHLILEAGADLVGIPLDLPVNEEDIDFPTAAAISRNWPGKVCWITYLDQAAALTTKARELGVQWVQLHGAIALPQLQSFRQSCPNLRIIKSLVIGQHPLPRLIRDAEAFAPWVDAFITDTYDPQTGAEGATGKQHDWRQSAALRAHTRRPLILAGGLEAGNVAQAILRVEPAGVDAHTLLEGPDGRKDPEKVAAFVAAAHSAWARLASE